MKTYSNAIWLDTIKNMQSWLESNLQGAQSQHQSSGKDILTVFVVYDLPGRDCHALASNGELLANDGDLARYKSEYIDVIEGHLKTYKSQPVVLIVEPNSLTNLVTNLESTPACSDSEKYYREGNAYLIKKFGVLPHVALYLDIGHAYLLGWDDTREKAARLYHDVIRSGAPGNIRGFADNIGGFVPWDDPNLSNGPETEWNPCPDEKRYLKAMYSDFVSAGIHSVKFVTDTSHNGKKFDYSDRELWCKSTSAGVGARPMAIPITTIDYLDAFYWIKPFGNVSELPNQSSFDNVCKDGLEIYSSDTWSQKVFEEGIKNANPPL
jgi:cellulose 1,4-beta-cellobiosidase